MTERMSDAMAAHEATAVTVTQSSLHLPSDPPLRLSDTRWDSAQTLAEFIAAPIANHELWRATTRLALLSDEHAERARRIDARSRVLVLLEDWCGDAIYSVPFVQAIADANALVELRVLTREGNDDLMSRHLTRQSRSIPVVMRFDAEGLECGWWGPRPSPLQQWVMTEGLAMDKPLRYKAVRTWYARDRGRTTVVEVLSLLER